MVLHVADRVLEGGLEPVVATDDPRIQAVCQQAGVAVELTSPEHPSGSDRVWEAAQRFPKARWVINVQGDEPLFDGSVLLEMVALLREGRAPVVTLGAPLPYDEGALQDPSVVKVQVGPDGLAVDFTRSSPPAGVAHATLQHLGCYGFGRAALGHFVSLPPSSRELRERLEQLRLVQAGVPIAVLSIDQASPSVDTPSDLERVRALMGVRPQE